MPGPNKASVRRRRRRRKTEEMDWTYDEGTKSFERGDRRPVLREKSNRKKEMLNDLKENKGYMKLKRIVHDKER